MSVHVRAKSCSSSCENSVHLERNTQFKLNWWRVFAEPRSLPIGENVQFMTEIAKIKSRLDFAAVAFGTCGVGFIPLAPGTFGSLVGVLIYLAAAWTEAEIGARLSAAGWDLVQVTAWFGALNLLAFLLFCVWFRVGLVWKRDVRLRPRGGQRRTRVTPIGAAQTTPAWTSALYFS